MKLSSIFKRKPKAKKPEEIPSPQAENITTTPLTDNQIASAMSKRAQVLPQQLISACGQDNGRQRDHNEDSLFTFSTTISGDKNAFPFGLFVICDGMGGYQYGEVASNVATRSLSSYLMRKFQPALLDPTLMFDEPIHDLMRDAIHEAQRAVLQAAPGSGTTLTAVLVLGQQMTIGHVGDSRAYALYVDGRVDPLTRDHSLVKRLEELGQLSSNEAAVHPHRNVLYRALGQTEALEPDIFTTQFPQPGHLMICSDGLWSVVPEERFGQIIHDSPTLLSACQNMVAAANEAGGPDNISVILVQLFG